MSAHRDRHGRELEGAFNELFDPPVPRSAATSSVIEGDPGHSYRGRAQSVRTEDTSSGFVRASHNVPRRIPSLFLSSNRRTRTMVTAPVALFLAKYRTLRSLLESSLVRRAGSQVPGSRRAPRSRGCPTLG